MKSKFHINRVCDDDLNVTVYDPGAREFETREEAESVMFSLRRASEAAGFDTRYVIGEVLYLES